MPVYEVKTLVQADNQIEAQESVRISLPHTDPIVNQWGYYNQIDSNTQQIYQKELDSTKESPKKGKRANKGRSLSPEHKAALIAGRQRAREKRLQGV